MCAAFLTRALNIPSIERRDQCPSAPFMKKVCQTRGLAKLRKYQLARENTLRSALGRRGMISRRMSVGKCLEKHAKRICWIVNLFVDAAAQNLKN